jgi:hypothetical protein
MCIVVLKQTAQQQGSSGTQAVAPPSMEELVKKKQIEDTMAPAILAHTVGAPVIEVSRNITVQIIIVIMTHGEEVTVCMELMGIMLMIPVQVMVTITT